MISFVDRVRNHWINATATKNGVVATANADGTLTLSGASTGETSVFSVDITTLKPGETYTASVNKGISSGTQAYFAVRSYSGSTSKALASFGSTAHGLVKTFTVPADSDKCTCMLYSASAGDVNDGTYEVMLNLGEAPIPWRKPGVPLPRVDGGDGFGVGVHHLSDFGQCVSSRNTGAPSKRLVTKSVPGMSGFYDFSEIYGSASWESREVQYVVQMLGEDGADLQRQKSDLSEWLSEVHDEEIYDDDLPDWHFKGSLSSIEWEEGETGEDGTLTATFLCHPFLIADEWTSMSLSVGSHTVTNPGKPVNPTCAPSTGAATVEINDVSQSISQETRLSMQLKSGSNDVVVSTHSVTLKYREERL